MDSLSPVLSPVQAVRGHARYAARHNVDLGPAYREACRAYPDVIGRYAEFADAYDIEKREMAEPAWTVASIAERKAGGDELISRAGWVVSFDTSSNGGRLSCVRHLFDEVIERDTMDGQKFGTAAAAECWALNRGRLQWQRDALAELKKALAGPEFAAMTKRILDLAGRDGGRS